MQGQDLSGSLLQISDNPAKFQPLVEADIEQVNAGINLNEQWNSEPITADNAGHRLVTRMERETLSRFPKSRAILFTIRTHMKPLSRFQEMPDKVIDISSQLQVKCYSLHFNDEDTAAQSLALMASDMANIFPASVAKCFAS